MERIGIRELRQHASRYLERVRHGESLEVSDRGRLVALLIPPSSARAGRDRLVAEGRLVPASGPLRLPRSRVRASRATAEVLDELRSDR
jgi:prevent-host-death family protein